MDFGYVVFILAWVLAIGYWVTLRVLKPETKHRLYKRLVSLYAGGLALLFLAWGASGGWRGIAGMAVIVLPFAALMTYVLRQVRICSSCGGVTQPRNFFKPADYCPKCGAPHSN